MGGSGRVTRWVVGVVLTGLFAALFGYWVLDMGAPRRFCGDEAHAQMRRAFDEMSSVIPASAFTIMDDCGSGSEVYAVWEVDDLDALVGNARAFGCRIEDRGFRDNEHGFLTCDTSTMKALFYLDPWVKDGASPVSGSMQRVE